MASANLGVLGGFPSDDVVEVESDEDFRAVWRLRAAGRFLSSLVAMAKTVYDEREEKKTEITETWTEERKYSGSLVTGRNAKTDEASYLEERKTKTIQKTSPGWG